MHELLTYFINYLSGGVSNEGFHVIFLRMDIVCSLALSAFKEIEKALIVSVDMMVVEKKTFFFDCNFRHHQQSGLKFISSLWFGFKSYTNE